jgi:hypothetical protein
MVDSVRDALTRAFRAKGRRTAPCRAARAGEVEQRIQALLRDGLMDRRVHDAYFRATFPSGATDLSSPAAGYHRRQQASSSNG